MAVINTNYLPGDPMLIDRIMYELKSQGIFDEFRKECIADVDTKPAYQNLRQRVEGSVAGFLKKQKWKPEMNKNQVREMLRKSIYESGFLETGVDRIVNQVVNPKIEKMFQPKVAEVVYKYLGIEKPIKEEETEKKDVHSSVENLLPTDLEAVSPESEIEKKLDKSFDTSNLDDSKNDDDESPPFEPLEEQPSYLAVEENSIDSHMSGFSGLASHDSNSNENTKAIDPDLYNQDSQISKHSSDDHITLSVPEESDMKLEGGEDSRASKSSKSRDSPVKNFDLSPDLIDKGSNSSNSKSSTKKEKPKSDDKKNDKKSDLHKHRSRHDSKSEYRNDRDKKNEKRDSKDRHKDSRDSSKDSRERKDSKSSHNNRDKERRSSSSKHSSSSRDHSNSKKESSSKEDKLKSSYNKEKDVKRDSKSNSKSDKYRREDKNHRSHSSSSKKDKDVTASSSNKKEPKKENKDDHFSSKTKKYDRRSTDRDSNDGQSGNFGNSTTPLPDNSNEQQSNKVQENSSSNSGSGSNDSAASDNVETASTLLNNDIDENRSIIKLIKPKFASNIYEARKLMKIRKHLHKLEQRMFEKTVIATADEMNSTNDTVSSEDLEITKTDSLSPEFNNSVSAAAWDAIEAKLNSQIYNNSATYNEYSDYTPTDVDEKCLYLTNDIPEETLQCKVFIERLMDSYYIELNKSSKTNQIQNDNYENRGIKRKMFNLENDVQNNNKKFINNTIESHEQLFSLPLSPESDKSIDITEKQRKCQNKDNKAKATQRYSSDDLYKPRLFNGSRRRTDQSEL